MQHSTRSIGHPRRLSLMAGALALALAGLAQAQTVSPPTEPSKGRAPVISSATIEYTGSGPQGTPLPNDVLTAVYAVSDPDGDAPDLAATDRTIQWLVDNVEAGPAGSKTYTVQPEDAGKVITFRLVPHTDATRTDPYQGSVTVAADLGQGGATSTQAASQLVYVTMSGDAVVATNVTATPVCVVTCGDDVGYQWLIEDAVGSGTYVEIAGATSATYRPIATEQNRNLKVRATQAAL